MLPVKRQPPSIKASALFFQQSHQGKPYIPLLPNLNVLLACHPHSACEALQTHCTCLMQRQKPFARVSCNHTTRWMFHSGTGCMPCTFFFKCAETLLSWHPVLIPCFTPSRLGNPVVTDHLLMQDLNYVSASATHHFHQRRSASHQENYHADWGLPSAIWFCKQNLCLISRQRRVPFSHNPAPRAAYIAFQQPLHQKIHQASTQGTQRLLQSTCDGDVRRRWVVQVVSPGSCKSLAPDSTGFFLVY